MEFFYPPMKKTWGVLSQNKTGYVPFLHIQSIIITTALCFSSACSSRGSSFL